MPNIFSFAGDGGDDGLQEVIEEATADDGPIHPMPTDLGGVLKKHKHYHTPTQTQIGSEPHLLPEDERSNQIRSYQELNELSEGLLKRLPITPPSRPQTIDRQASERRERLFEVPPGPTEKRAGSVDRPHGVCSSDARRTSLQEISSIPSLTAQDASTPGQSHDDTTETLSLNDDASRPSRPFPDLTPLEIPHPSHPGIQEIDDDDDDDEEPELDAHQLQDECDQRWILNLSMHFRDKSNREKFFVTYAETLSKWRRLTVSLDYRNAPEGSLEADLSTLHYQRDKSVRIYEAIRESLPDIQYYDTVTNLKLETTPEDGQLHVHVREDANEIVKYPSTSLFRHIQARRIPENEVDFISHLSGFVYKVQAGGTTVIKKDIPGPDSVDEFLYEVNALDSLSESNHVIRLEGLVTDEDRTIVKGLLITFAPQGALVDMLYDFRNTGELPWHRREKWARQIVEGLSDIHEAGFVQGDFTLSNIVIDEGDNAQIIDINRRGCPVGWEPPELGRLIDSGQRISMCISVKTDLYQLGMVLWALAEEADDPDHQRDVYLPPVSDSTPVYFRHLVETCLSHRPQHRISANQLLREFPGTSKRSSRERQHRSSSRPVVDFADHIKISPDESIVTHRSGKEYIDPDLAVTLEDVCLRHQSQQKQQSTNRRNTDASNFTSGQVTYVDPQVESHETSSYRFGSSGSWVVGHHRGRGRGRSRSPVAFGPDDRPPSSVTSLSKSPPSRSRPRCGSECSARHGNEDLGDGDCQADQVNVKLQPENRILSNLRATTATGGEDGRDQSQITSLMHQDSGFDETMLENLDLDLEAGGSRTGKRRYLR